MLYKTKGVVFRFTRYGETSIIVTIFTSAFGLRSYIVNGVRSKNAKNRIALFQPLTLLDMVVYDREMANINRIKELKCIHPYQTIPIDVRRSSVALFINEVISKTIREETHAENLCDFLIDSLITLDSATVPVENFHLIFLVKLSRFLGFGIQNVNQVVAHRFVDEALEEQMRLLIDASYTDHLSMNNPQRRQALDLLIGFFTDHLETMGELKSVQVLREVLI